MRILFLCLFLFVGPFALAQPQTEFLYGASVYPEFQTKAEQLKLLDYFQQANINVIRVGETSWGNLQPDSATFTFGWLRQYLDELHRRGLKAILGTSSYHPPQWLAARHPEVLFRFEDGRAAHPLGRRVCSRSHPVYRKYVFDYVRRLVAEFGNHPAVVAWQVDNEIDLEIEQPAKQINYNPAHQRAFTDWLRARYHTVDELNERFHFTEWGLRVNSFEDLPLPRETIDGSDLPLLKLAYYQFEGESIADFLKQQADLLRRGGAKGEIMTDWTTRMLSPFDLPTAKQAFSLSGLNIYQPKQDNTGFWQFGSMSMDWHRSVLGKGAFWLTETRIGVAGATSFWDHAPERDQFLMWMLQPAAFGATSLMHWSGNRFYGGHWPHWGAIIDWNGEPDLDYAWVKELGTFYKKWGKTLVQFPVQAEVAVLTDFNLRAGLREYPHTKEKTGEQIILNVFSALHRLGVGVDALGTDRAADAVNLNRYKLLVIPAASTLDGARLLPALRAYVRQGGQVIVTPMCEYQNEDGIFQKDGLHRALGQLTGVAVPHIRYVDVSKNKANRLTWTALLAQTATDPSGFCEVLEARTDSAQVIARYSLPGSILNGKPAAYRRKLGSGQVLKLGNWPGENDFVALLNQLGFRYAALAGSVPAEVLTVPRTDGSLFALNVGSKPQVISLKRPVRNRVDGRRLTGPVTMKPYEVLWLEPTDGPSK